MDIKLFDSCWCKWEIIGYFLCNCLLDFNYCFSVLIDNSSRDKQSKNEGYDQRFNTYWSAMPIFNIFWVCAFYLLFGRNTVWPILFISIHISLHYSHLARFHHTVESNEYYNIICCSRRGIPCSYCR